MEKLTTQYNFILPVVHYIIFANFDNTMLIMDHSFLSTSPLVDSLILESRVFIFVGRLIVCIDDGMHSSPCGKAFKPEKLHTHI